MQRASKTIAKTEAILIVLVVVFAGAAAYAFTQSTKSTTTITSAAQDLVACAQAEGAVSIYGLVDTPDWGAKITPAWQVSYPNIKMSYLGLSSGDLTNKVLAEHKAGQTQSDVIETFVNGINSLDQQGAITEWNNPVETQMGYATPSLDPKGAFHPFAVYETTPIFNKNVVKNNATLPKTWNDFFTSATWKNLVAYSKPTVLGTGAGILYGLSTNMTNANWINFMKQAAANNPILTDSDGGSATDAITGQAAVGIAGTNDIQAALAKNAPIAPLWLSPVYIARVPIGLVAGSAHPCAGKLFVEWAASWAGQQAVGSSLRTPWFPPAAAASPVLNAPPNVSLYYYDTAQYSNNASYYSQTYKSIFGA